MKVVVAITGASGAVYAQRLLRRLVDRGDEIHLTVSERGRDVLRQELGVSLDMQHLAAAALLDRRDVSLSHYHYLDFTAPFASGSNVFDAMVIIPCSMGTLGRIAAGTSENLIIRAADVFLKERRRLMLVVRETPLNLIHLRNMVTVTEAGAIVLPACPAFYDLPAWPAQEVDMAARMVDSVVNRVLMHLDAARLLQQ